MCVLCAWPGVLNLFEEETKASGQPLELQNQRRRQQQSKPALRNRQSEMITCRVGETYGKDNTEEPVQLLRLSLRF
jgi:hypothetical protein